MARYSTTADWARRERPRPVIENYFAALYTQMVPIGAKNPRGEAVYEDYERVQFCGMDRRNIEPIEFPAFPPQVTHLVVMDFAGVVISCQNVRGEKS